MASLINSLAGSSLLSSSGSSASSSLFQPVEVDLSVLAQANQSTGFDPLDIVPKAFTTKKVQAPWQNGAKESPLAERATAAQTLAKFVDLDDPAVKRAGDDKDLQATFAAYRALKNLQALAAYAGDDKTPSTALAGLDAAFKKGLDEVRAFAETAAGSKLQLLPGDKKTSLQSISVPSAGRVFNGAIIQKNAASDAIADLNGDEVFTLTLKKTGSLAGTAPDHSFTIDLSEIEGTRTVGKVVDLINKKISALTVNGGTTPVFSTRAALQVDVNGDFGLRFTAASTEQLSLDAPDVKPSVHLLTERTVSGSATIGQLTRLDEADGRLSVNKPTAVAGIDAKATALAKQIFDEVDSKATVAKGAPKPTAPGSVNAATQARAIATDSQGFVYVVGRTSGNLGAQLNPSGRDIFLTKYAPDGKAVFSRLVGSSDNSDGFAVTVDKDDNVIIAGQTSDQLDKRDIFKGQDGFVSKFASNGAELFTVQLDGVGDDSARAVTTDANGDIFVAGVVDRGSVTSGAASVGGKDVYVARIDGSKHVVEGLTSRIEQVAQLGTAGADDVGGLAFGADGRLLLATTENGRAIVHALDPADIAAGGDSADLGDLAGGRVSGLAVDAATGDIAVIGSTRSGDLDAGPATGAAVDGDDGFVARLGGDLSRRGVTYLASSGADGLSGVVARDGLIYVAGQTTGDLAGARKGASDAFLARIDAGTGAIDDITAAGEAGASLQARGLAIGDATSPTLEKLGLRAGVLNPDQSSDLLSGTSLRAGDYFYVSINGAKARKITIEEGDTLARLARKINVLSPQNVSATVSLNRLTLRQVKDGEVKLTPGADGQDALAKLGIEPTTLLPAAKLFGLSTEKKAGRTTDISSQTPGGVFALGLDPSLSLGDRKTAKFVSGLIDKSIEQVQRAYRSLYYDPTKAKLAQRQAQNAGNAPAYLTKQLASYKDALARLGG